MALWEGVFQDMDPLTLSTIVELQLQDSQQLVANAKGKEREGTMSDGALALQMYIEDLTTMSAVLDDRRIAQSVTTAVLLDSRFLRREYELQDQAARDHQLARSMQDDGAAVPAHASTKPSSGGEQDIWMDDEFLAKMAAMYVGPSTPPALVYDSDSDGTVAESSHWAAVRGKNETPKKGHCIACGDDMDFIDVARVPCNHEYCRPCLAQLFELSMTDESLFPPRCDSLEIPVARVRFWLPDDLLKRYEAAYSELIVAAVRNSAMCAARNGRHATVSNGTRTVCSSEPHRLSTV
ncbi:hypothetical protein LTR62_007120 [Meristemomyces frigidus]|uniref:RING-type domain-containing protein n=1 Tax=Meristemomyces frigidus TaxID=1508187 RepID=A0AAN7TB13_9PEZI|nr:hypothetical protein LTR62_007120 [Meristemomyces frigidus]